MPSLNQVTCSLQLGSTKLKEFGHRYMNGGIEVLVGVPETNLPFQLRVTSSGYIAPGLAAYVFMDGQYQCNRNRQRLIIPGPGVPSNQYEIDFLFRQREEEKPDGTFVAREWNFTGLDTVNADNALDISSDFANNVGTIEVVILRCKNEGVRLPLDNGVYVAPKNSMPPKFAGFGDSHSKCSLESVAEAKPSSYKTSVPSKAPSRAPTGKSTMAPSDAMGGMFGLFDGANDESEDDRRRFWPYPGAAAYYHFQAEDSIEHPRNRARKGGDPRLSATSGLQSSKSSSAALGASRHSHHVGFPFIQGLCDQVFDINTRAYEGRKQIDDLQQDAQKYHNRPDLHLVALKALKQKQYEVETIDQELQSLWTAIFGSMRRMDEAAWKHTRDFLVAETKLVTANHPELQQWKDPLQSHGPPSHAGERQDSKSGWQEVGEGVQKPGGAWDGDHNKAGKTKTESNKWAGSPKTASKKPQSSNNWAANKTDSKKSCADNWGDNKTASKKSVADNWGDNKTASKKSNADNWGDNKTATKKSVADNWGNENQKDNASERGRDKAKSQSHTSKVNNWNVGGDEKDGANASGKKTNIPHRETSGSTKSTDLMPVIKSYWDQPGNSDNAKPGARDAYVYPAPPKPALPGGKANSVSRAIQAGRGADYAHDMYRPEYLDTMKQPYAVFTFKYRSKNALEKILTRTVDMSYMQGAIEEAGRQKLMSMPKDKLVDRVMNPYVSPLGQKHSSPAVSPQSTRKPTTKSPGNKDSDNGKGDWGGGKKSAKSNNDGSGWGKPSEKKSVSKKSTSGWGGAGDNGAGGGGGWAASSDKKASGGGGEWSNKSKSATPNHFGSDKNLKATKGRKPSGGAVAW